MTTTSTGPVVWAGVFAVSVVLLRTLTSVAAPPSITAAPDSNPLPSIRTAVAPPVEPSWGEIYVTLTGGGGGGVIGTGDDVDVGAFGDLASHAIAKGSNVSRT